MTGQEAEREFTRLMEKHVYSGDNWREKYRAWARYSRVEYKRLPPGPGSAIQRKSLEILREFIAQMEA